MFASASPPLPSGRDRDAALAAWIDVHAARYGLQPASLTPASSDASFRRYLRVRRDGGGTLIVMDAPPGLEDLGPFLHVRDAFAACGVRVPQVIAADRAAGFVLLEDFGATHYLAALDETTAPGLYAVATDALIAIQLGTRPGVLPPYDEALLRRELELFRAWYCGRHLGATLTDAQHATLDRTFALLIANNRSQAQVHVHRDYHSRNLMLLGAAAAGEPVGPGILDFQDAVHGPVTYDLVSLLRDAYIDWDEEQVLDWAVRYWERARRAGLPVNADFGEFYRDFEWMGLQRHLKVLGIFARLKHRDGKDAYLKDLPRVLQYTRKCAERYTAFRGLLGLLDALAGAAPQAGYTF